MFSPFYSGCLYLVQSGGKSRALFCPLPEINMAVGFARIGEGVYQLQRSGLSQGSLWSQWEAGQNPLGTREVGCDPGRLTLVWTREGCWSRRLLKTTPKRREQVCLKGFCVWFCLCEIPVVFCFCHARKIACSGKLFVVSLSFSLALLERHKIPFCLNYGG